MTHPNTLNPITSQPPPVAGDHGRVAGLGPSSRRPTMNRYVKGQTINQQIRLLTDLLKTYARLDARAASGTLAELTERLAADIRKDCPAFSVGEVGR